MKTYKNVRQLALCFVLALLPSFLLSAKPVNVLFILTDDQSYNTIHAHGNERIATPNLDKLAKSGMSFTHVFNQGSWSGAVCAASRRMINTGRNLFLTGRGPEKLPESQVKKIKLMGQTFRENGYQTFMTGKWHLDEADWVTSFDQGQSIFLHGMSYLKKGGQFNAELANYNPQKQDFEHFKGNKHTSEMIADAAVNFIDADHQKPFMMYVGFLAPHDPRQAPETYYAKYPGNSIELPANFKPQHPFNQGDSYIRDEKLLQIPRTAYATKQFIGDYYAMIEHTDAQIGRILDALQASGQADNTLIVFTSDHGLAVGSHGLLGKQSQYDHSVRSPFIVKGPGVPAGKQAPGMFYLHSVYPTIAQMAGIKIPESVQAPSIVPLIKGEKTQMYDSIYGAYRHFQRMLRTDDYKLIYYPHIKKTQLFDMKNDPYEINNLAGEAKYQSLIKSMMSQLEDWKKVVNDPLDNNAVRKSYKVMGSMYDSNKRPKDWPPIN